MCIVALIAKCSRAVKPQWIPQADELALSIQYIEINTQVGAIVPGAWQNKKSDHAKFL